MKLADRLHKLRAGEVPFAAFARDTQHLWGYLAGRLLRCNDPGIGVGEEDVRQELLVGAWVAVKRFDPTRGVGIDRYVLFNACDRAKKWLGHQREQDQSREGRGRTRAPSLGKLDTVERELLGGSYDPRGPMLAGIGARAGYARVRGQLSREERVVMEALIATRDAAAAALSIYNHYPHRIGFRLGSEQAALRMVRRVASRICDEAALLSQLEE